VPRLPFIWVWKKAIPFLFWVVAITSITLRANAFEVPPLEGRVNDRAALLSPDLVQKLTARLAAHDQATGVEFAILTVDSLGGVPIEDYGIRVVESWKLGKKGKDNGVLLLVAKNDRKMRIEVGYGLEGTLPDIEAGRIVRDIMAPRFRRGDYAGGITQATEAIIGKTGGQLQANAGDDEPRQTLNDQSTRKKTVSAPTGIIGTIFSIIFGLIKFAFIIIIIILFILFNIFGGGGRGRRGGGGVFFSSGGGSGGSDFGGGFSGGGGSFGGGGASGDW
jgi:uncharacterized protein